MVTLPALLLPILIAAAVVFVASFVMHMVLPYHHSDFGRLPGEEKLMDAVRNAGVAPGDYMMPCGDGPSAMKDPAFQDKMNRGPVAIMTVMQPGFAMGKNLAMWFAYCLVIGLFAAYVASRHLSAEASYMEVFRLVSTVAFAGYALAQWQDSIWYKRKWSTTMKNTFDGLVYALLTAGVFSWLWP